MDTAKPRTIFITGATGLVGGHAAEEALRRGHRVRALVRASSDTRWLDQLGVEKVAGRPGGRRIAAAGSRRGRLGVQLRGQGGRLGHARGIPPPQRRCPPAASRRGLRRSGRATGARQLAGRLRGSRPSRHRRDRPTGGQLARRLHSLEDRGRGLGPEIPQGALAPRGHRPPRLHLRRARSHRPAQAALEPAARDVRLLRLGRTGPQLHLRQEPCPRHLSGRGEPGRPWRGLQSDRWRAREQDPVRQPRGRAGRPAASHATYPAGSGAVAGHGGRGGREAARSQECPDHQQGPIQVPGAAPRLLDRQGAEDSGLPTTLQLR